MNDQEQKIGHHSFTGRWFDKNGVEIAHGDLLKLEYSLLDKETFKEIKRGTKMAHVVVTDGKINLVGTFGEDLSGWLHDPGNFMEDVEIITNIQ